MHPILEKLSVVRNRIRTRIFIRGFTLLFLGSIIAAAALMFADSRIQSDHPLWTYCLSLSCISFMVLLVFRGIIFPLFKRLPLLDLALDIESHEREWNHELSASVSFLERDSINHETTKTTQNTPHKTSLAPLMHEVITRTQSRLEGRTPESFLSTHQTWSWLFALVVTGSSIVAFVLCFPVTAHFTSQRLLRPGLTSWPVASRLVLLNERFEIEPGPSVLIPVKVGKNFYVEDRVDAPPTSLIFQTETPSGLRRALRSSPRKITDRDGNTRTLFKIQVPADLDDGAQFRLWDDTNHATDWYQIVRDTPIAIRTLEVTITPPNYLDQASETFANPSRTIECPVGSVVTFRGTTTRAFADIWQQVQRKTTPVTRVGESEFQFEISATSARITTTLFATAPQLPQDQRRPHHHFLSRFRLRGRDDEDPIVEMESPSISRNITPISTLRPRLIARDDHGLSTVQLLLSINERELTTLPVKDGTVPEIELQKNIDIHLPDLLATQTPAPVLQPGDEITLTLQAHDQRNPVQWVSSDPITLTVLSQEDFLQEHATQLASLMETIRQLEQRLQQLHLQTEELSTQYNASGHLLSEDRVLLQSTIDTQRQLLSRINDSTGLLPQFQDLSMALLDNGATGSPIDRNIKAVQAVLDTICNAHFIPATEQLRQLARPGNRLFDEQANLDPASMAAFQNILEHQQSALVLFENLRQSGKHHSTQQQIQQGWFEANAALTQLQQSTITLGRETIGRDRNNLTTPQQTALDRAATKYRQLSGTLNSLEVESLQAPSISPEVKQLIQASRFSNTIATAAAHIEANQMAMAIEHNESTLEQFKQLLLALAPLQSTTPQQHLFNIAVISARLANQQDRITEQTEQFKNDIQLESLSRRSRKRTRIDLIKQEQHVATIVKTELALPDNAKFPAIETQIEWIQKDLEQTIRTLDDDQDSQFTETILTQNRITQRLHDLAHLLQNTPLIEQSHNQTDGQNEGQSHQSAINWQLLLLMQKRLIEREEELLPLPNIPDHIFQQLAAEQTDIAQLLNKLADE